MFYGLNNLKNIKITVYDEPDYSLSQIKMYQDKYKISNDDLNDFCYHVLIAEECKNVSTNE